MSKLKDFRYHDWGVLRQTAFLDKRGPGISYEEQINVRVRFYRDVAEGKTTTPFVVTRYGSKFPTDKLRVFVDSIDPAVWDEIDRVIRNLHAICGLNLPVSYFDEESKCQRTHPGTEWKPEKMYEIILAVSYIERMLSDIDKSAILSVLGHQGELEALEKARDAARRAARARQERKGSEIRGHVFAFLKQSDGEGTYGQYAKQKYLARTLDDKAGHEVFKDDSDLAFVVALSLTLMPVEPMREYINRTTGVGNRFVVILVASPRIVPITWSSEDPAFAIDVVEETTGAVIETVTSSRTNTAMVSLSTGIYRLRIGTEEPCKVVVYRTVQQFQELTNSHSK